MRPRWQPEQAPHNRQAVQTRVAAFPIRKNYGDMDGVEPALPDRDRGEAGVWMPFQKLNRGMDAVRSLR